MSKYDWFPDNEWFPGDDPAPQRRPVIRLPKVNKWLLLLAGALLLVSFLLPAFAEFYTDWLWFDSVEKSEVFTTQLLVKAGLFVVFGALMSVSIFLFMWWAYRTRPEFRGITEANAVLPWVFAFAAVLWLASFVPGLEDATRIRVLRASCWILGGSAVAWIAWALLRHAMAVT